MDNLKIVRNPYGLWMVLYRTVDPMRVVIEEEELVFVGKVGGDRAEAEDFVKYFKIERDLV